MCSQAITDLCAHKHAAIQNNTYTPHLLSPPRNPPPFHEHLHHIVITDSALLIGFHVWVLLHHPHGELVEVGERFNGHAAILPVRLHLLHLQEVADGGAVDYMK